MAKKISGEAKREMDEAQKASRRQLQAAQDAKHRSLRSTLMAALEAPSQEIASGLIEGLVKAGWRLNDQFLIEPSVRLGGGEGLIAAEIAANFQPAWEHETGAWAARALGAMGADWNKRRGLALAPMETAARLGNAPALRAMEDTGGDWLGGMKKPACSPIAALWATPMREWAQGAGCGLEDFAALRESSWKALESAVDEGRAEAGPWASQLGASLLYGQAQSDGPASRKAWTDFLKRCAKRGWRLDAPLEHPSKEGSLMVNGLGVGSVERPTLSLALALRAGEGDAKPWIQALKLGLVEVDERSLWALSRGAASMDGLSRAEAADALLSALEEATPWAERLARSNELPTLIEGAGERWGEDRVEELRGELDFGLGQACAWLCSPESPEDDGRRPMLVDEDDAPKTKPPAKLGAREAKTIATAMAAREAVGSRPGAPSWEAFKAQWEAGWERFSQEAPEDGSRHGWINQPKVRERALAALRHLSGMGEAGDELATAGLAGWARATARASEQGARSAPEAPQMSRWIEQIQSSGLKGARGELVAACDACLNRGKYGGSRAELDHLHSLRTKVESASLVDQARPARVAAKRASL